MDMLGTSHFVLYREIFLLGGGGGGGGREQNCVLYREEAFSIVSFNWSIHYYTTFWFLWVANHNNVKTSNMPYLLNKI